MFFICFRKRENGMTHVTAAKLPLVNKDIVVGQVWYSNDTQIKYTVESIEMLPSIGKEGFRDSFVLNDGSARVRLSFDNLGKFTTFDLLPNSPTREDVGGLQDNHLLDLYNTIAVGQRWLHHKGNVYVITAVGLDANLGIYQVDQARINYRPLQSGKSPEWSLTVSEFLSITAEGKKRFTPVKLTGKEKRDVLADKSLRFYWRMYA